MRNLLPAFHNSDNCRLGFERTISGHALVRLPVFLFGLLGLYLVDLDAILRVVEAIVDAKIIAGTNIFAFGHFAKDAVFGAGQGLECPFEFNILWLDQQPGLFTRGSERESLPKPVTTCRSG